MKWFEALGYVFMYGYLAFGLGYFLRKGLTAVNLDTPREPIIPVIGIHETPPINIDYLFEEIGLLQIDPTPEYFFRVMTSHRNRFLTDTANNTLRCVPLW